MVTDAHASVLLTRVVAGTALRCCGQVKWTL